MAFNLPENPNTRRWLGLMPAILTIFFFMVIPITILGVFSFKPADPYGGVESGFSLEAWIQLFFERDLDDSLIFEPVYLQIILRSIILGLLATAASLLMGFPVAWYIVQQPTRQRDLLLFLVTIPFWTNLLIRAYAWILILGKDGMIEKPLYGLGLIDESLELMYGNLAIGVGLIYSYIPLMILPIYASLEKLDTSLIEAARDLYANRWTVIRRIVIPLCLPGIVAGCILVFVLSLGDFISPSVLGGGKRMMLSNLIQFQFSSARNWPFGGALTMLLLLMVAIGSWFYMRVSAKDGAVEH
ncbi:MAG: ABC transporter permease subunit [Gammaproteobacteria bacterium]|nr:ABC transporter permease subunit [Gammaproteobacteria bacterium]NKB62967.1 ABC transporter permease subunit [Gammaproteobacteria bacterium]